MSKCCNSECGCENSTPPDGHKPHNKAGYRIAFLFACAATGYGASYLYYTPETIMEKYSVVDADRAELLRKEKAVAAATGVLIAAMALKYQLSPRVS